MAFTPAVRMRAPFLATVFASLCLPFAGAAQSAATAPNPSRPEGAPKAPSHDAVIPAPAKGGVSWDAMLALVRNRFPKVRQLSTAELDLWLKNPARIQPQVLDVREPAEFDVSHLAGAVRVSPGAAAKDILPSLDARRPIVVYCSVGYRSSRLATRLLQAGRNDVSNLEGSIFIWANEDRPLVTRDNKATTLVHPFDFVYGRLLKPERRAP